MGLQILLPSFLKSQLLNIGFANQLAICFEFGFAELIIIDIKIGLVPKGTTNRVVLFVEVVRCLEVAVDHGVGSKALLAVVFNEEKIA